MEKTVKLHKVEKEEKEEQNKLTYEQLNDACNQLWQQNQQLIKKCREMESVITFKKLDYLFKVVEFSSVIKDAEFLNSCIEEIKDAMTPPIEEEEEEAGTSVKQ